MMAHTLRTRTPHTSLEPFVGPLFIALLLLMVLMFVPTQFTQSQILFDLLLLLLCFVLSYTLYQMYQSVQTLGKTKTDLEYNHRKYQSLFNLNGIGIVAVDMNGCFLETNAAYRNFIGYTETELKQMCFRDIAHPDDMDWSEEQLVKLVKGHISNLSTERRYIHKQGHFVWANLHVSVVAGDDQRPSFMLLTIQDVTLAKLDAAQLGRLLESERTQKLTANTLTEVTLALAAITNPNDLLTEILKQANRLVDYQTGNIALRENGSLRIMSERGYEEQGLSSLIGLKQPLTQFALDAHAIKNTKPYIIADTLEKPHWVGKTRTWIRSHLALPIVRGETVLGILRLDAPEPNYFSAQDLIRLTPLANASAIALHNAQLYKQIKDELAEREWVESELLKSEQRVSTTLDSINGVAWSLDPSTMRLINLTETIWNLYRRPHTDFLNDPRLWYNLIHPDDQPRIRNGMKMLYETGKLEREYRAVLENDRFIWLQDRLRVVYDDQGKPHRIDGLTVDITQRKFMEQQLQLSQKMEAVGQLASGLAHDFNNFLVIIIGNSNILLDNLAPDDPRHRELEQIRAAGERAARLTNQLLTFGRQKITSPQPLDLNSTILGMEDLLQQFLHTPTTLDIQLGEDLPQFMADEGQIEQVLMNLVVNARDAISEAGNVSIVTDSVTVTPHNHTMFGNLPLGSYLRLSVDDTGVGMDEETQHRIFEPFFTTKKEHGTGLGLSIVHGIVKQSQGHIRVCSTPQEGTIFQLYFQPLPRSDTKIKPQQSRPAHTTKVKSTEKISPANTTILLVDDEAGVRQVVKKVLEKRGYQVLQAEDGTAALEICQQLSDGIDLLVTDMMMPGEWNGYQLSTKIQQRYPDLRVLYMSGYAVNEDLYNIRASQQCGFIEKPFSFEDLTTAVERLLLNDPTLQRLNGSTAQHLTSV